MLDRPKNVKRAAQLIDRISGNVQAPPDFDELCLNSQRQEVCYHLAETIVSCCKDGEPRSYQVSKLPHAMLDKEQELLDLRYKIISLFLECDVEVHIADNKGYFPLHRAAKEGDSRLATLLLDGGGDVSCIDSRGCTPLHWAVLAKSQEVVSLLCERGASLTATDDDGHTPEQLALLLGKKKLARLVHANG